MGCRRRYKNNDGPSRLLTPAAFRKLALDMPGAELSSHHGSPDIRVGGKIFAQPADRQGEKEIAILKFTAEQQQMFCEAEPYIFHPVPGGWGHKGWTHMVVENADAATARSALWTAWRNVAPRKLQQEHPPQ